MRKNGQSAALSLNESQLQVILSGILGDGSICTSNSNSTYFVTNCKYEEYIDFKINLLGDMFKNKRHQEHNSFCNTPIFIVRTKSNRYLEQLRALSIQNLLNNLNELGIALWFYDDGSLHKKVYFIILILMLFLKIFKKDILYLSLIN